MAIKLLDLYEKTKEPFHLEIIAGKNGLHRILNWIYPTEEPGNLNSQHVGELIITTGALAKQSNTWLMDFVRKMEQKDACGLLLSIGNHIKKDTISAEVLEYCNTKNFPLILLPSEISIHDFTKLYFDQLYKNQGITENINHAFLSLFDAKQNHAAALSLLPKYHFEEETHYFVAILTAVERKVPTEQTNGKKITSTHLSDILWKHVIEADFPCHMIPGNRSYYLVCNCNTPQQIYDMTQNIAKQIRALPSKFILHIGIGGQINHLDKLSESHRQAITALRMSMHKKKETFTYEEMGFYKILLEIKDYSLLKNYVSDTLREVKAYDTKHKSDFSKTLQLYLLYSGSIQMVAADTGCHRNTINHRIKMMKEKMGYQLDNPKACMELMIAFEIDEYLKAIGM